MLPYAEQQVDQTTIVPLFQAFVQTQLLEAGVMPADLQRYEAANPAFMSVAGLMISGRRCMVYRVWCMVFRVSCFVFGVLCLRQRYGILEGASQTRNTIHR